MLSGLDRYLKSVLKSDGFIWEVEVQRGFPKEIYWYLYGGITFPVMKLRFGSKLVNSSNLISAHSLAYSHL